MFDRVFVSVCRKFSDNAAFTAAETRALGVAALKYKIFNIAMEGKPVIKAVIAKIYEILDRNGSFISVKLDFYRSEIL